MDICVSTELRAVIDELDRVREALIEDEQQSATSRWAERTKRDAETILARVEHETGRARAAG